MITTFILTNTLFSIHWCNKARQAIAAIGSIKILTNRASWIAQILAKAFIDIWNKIRLYIIGLTCGKLSWCFLYNWCMLSFCFLELLLFFYWNLWFFNRWISTFFDKNSHSLVKNIVVYNVFHLISHKYGLLATGDLLDFNSSLLYLNYVTMQFITLYQFTWWYNYRMFCIGLPAKLCNIIYTTFDFVPLRYGNESKVPTVQDMANVFC